MARQILAQLGVDASGHPHRQSPRGVTITEVAVKTTPSL
jgi:hypothetical protein